MLGSNRSFGYDAAASFANFIATPSLLDAFAVRSVIPTIPVAQVATNDHVLLSLLSHLIYSVTGSLPHSRCGAKYTDRSGPTATAPAFVSCARNGTGGR